MVDEGVPLHANKEYLQKVYIFWVVSKFPEIIVSKNPTKNELQY